MQCDRCGVTSPLDACFQRTPKSFHTGFRTLCPACAQRQRDTNFRTSLASIVIFGLLCLLPSSSSGGRWVTNLLLLTVFEYLSIIPHELGHAIAARLAKMEVFRITFGRGRQLAHWYFRGIVIEWRALPASGSVVSASLDLRAWRLRRLVVVSGGPIANLLLCWAAIEAGGGWSKVIAVDWTRHLAPWLMLATANAVLFVASLARRQVRIGDRLIPSDGRTIARLLFRPLPDDAEKRRNYLLAGAQALNAVGKYEALKEFVLAGREYLPPFEFNLWLGIASAGMGDFTAARSSSVTLLEAHGEPSATRASLLNAVAWYDLMEGKTEFLPEADRFSDEAYALAPWQCAIQSTRGWALTEQGKFDEGMPLLKQSLKSALDHRDQATIHCTLAIAESKRSDFDSANAHIRLAQRFDPNCDLLERARRACNPCVAI